MTDIKVVAVRWYWCSNGMTNKPCHAPIGMGRTSYVETSQVERLLEDAYRRGFEDAKSRALDFIARTG